MSPLYRVRFSPRREDDPSYMFGQLLEIHVTGRPGTIHRGITDVLLAEVMTAILAAHEALRWSGVEIASVEYAGRVVGPIPGRKGGD